MLGHLRRDHAPVCRQWFDDITPLGIADGSFTIRARTDIQRDYLRSRCMGPFNDAAQAASGRLLSVRVLGPHDDAPKPERAPVVETTERAPSRVVINPDYSFDSYVVGPSNRLAHAAAKAVAAGPGSTYNPLFIHGGVGLGKTHLLQAICVQLVNDNPHVRIEYVSCEEFVGWYIQAVQDGTVKDFQDRFRGVDTLVIDDIHFVAKRGRSQEEVFHTFNALHSTGRQIVLSSDAHPDEIPDLEERLVSRFKSGLVAQIDPPCYETRVAIVQAKAELRGVIIPDEVACLIAGRVDSNIRELEGALTSVQAVASLDDQPITLTLARQALGEPIDTPKREPTVEMITSVITDYYGVKLTELQSKRRQRSIALPRQVCMFLARQHTGKSLEEIGGHFGGRDHTTVMHAVRTVQQKRHEDDSFDAIVKSLEQRIVGP